MTKNPHFKLSVVYPQAFPLSREEDLVSDLARLSEFSAINSIELTTIIDSEIRREATEILHSSFAEVIFLAGLPSFKRQAFLNTSGAERERAVEYIKSLIEEANDLGASAFLVVSGPDVEIADRQESSRNLLTSLIELSEFMKINFPHISLRLEHTDRDVHRKQLIGPISESLVLIQGVAEAGYKLELNLDLSHILQLGEQVSSTLELAKAHCSHFHFSNCILKDKLSNLYGDAHLPFGYPGSEVAVNELTQTFRDLYSFGYLAPSRETTLGLEVVPLPNQDPWATLGVAIDVLNNAKTKAF